LKSLVLYTLQNYPAFYRFKTLKFIGFLRFIKWCSMLSRKNSRNHFFKHKPGNISKSSDQNQKSFSEIYFFHTTELWPKYEFDTRQKNLIFCLNLFNSMKLQWTSMWTKSDSLNCMQKSKLDHIFKCTLIRLMTIIHKNSLEIRQLLM